jgi:hypothetical protein
MPIPDFKTISAGVRASRVAVLVDAADPDWRETCRRIIECLSAQWGGKYSLIVPTDGTSISPLFWKLLNAYDPDYIVRYHKTARDIMLAHADDYRRMCDTHLKAVFGDEEMSDATLGAWEENIRNAAIDSFGINLDLENELIHRIAPLFFGQHVASHAFHAHSGARFPFTDVSMLLPYCQHAAQVTVLDTTAVGVLPLWVEAVTGTAHPSYEEALAKNGIRRMVVTLDDGNVSKVFNFIVSGSTRPGVRSAESDLQDLQLRISPFQYSMVGLSEYTSFRSPLPMVVVCGSELVDFALYFALSRLRANVCWLLPEWVAEFKTARDARGDNDSPLATLRPTDNRKDFNLRHFAQALLSSVDYHASQIQFVSGTLDESQIRDCIDSLDAAAHWGRGRIKALGQLSSVDGLLGHIQIAFNTDNYAVPVSQQLSENMELKLFPTPKPKGFTSIIPYEHRWITELRIDGHLYPRHPALGEWLVKQPMGTEGARAGSRGLCYFCPSVAYFGGDIDTILVRPTVYLPSADEMVEHLARAAGWTTRLSDKGFYSRETVTKLSGLNATADFLRTPTKVGILNEFLKSKPKPGEQVSRGKYLSSDQRWYIDFKVVAEVAGQGEATSLVDMLVSREILHRGLILKCQYCRNADWFALGEVAQGFRCKRCRREQNILSKHALHSAEPVWYYALD